MKINVHEDTLHNEYIFNGHVPMAMFANLMHGEIYKQLTQKISDELTRIAIDKFSQEVLAKLSIDAMAKIAAIEAGRSIGKQITQGDK